MFVKIAIIIIFVRLLQINGECSSDDTKQVTNCYDEYISKLEHYNNINSFEEYQKSISYYMENWAKIIVLCKNFNALSTCIKNSKTEKCVNNNNFKHVKTIWNDNSTLFATNYHTMNFMCGNGMKALTLSYECLQLFRNNSVQCRIHSDDCSLRENEISCFSIAANSSCGENARTFITNMLQIYLCQTHPECNRCKTSIAQNLSVNGFLLIVSLMISLIKHKILWKML